jgi:uncharacterized protein
MSRDELLELLRRHHPELQARFGVRSLALFGSHARDEAGPESDVDLVIEFEEGAVTWATYNELLDFLEALLGRGVDVVSLSRLKPRLRGYVEREMIRVA